MSKQYLILVDEKGRAVLGMLIPGLLYVEVEGVEIKQRPTHMVLVTPKPEETKVDSPVEELTDSKEIQGGTPTEV